MLIRDNGSVEGEVYWIADSHWGELDAWEEVPTVYRRTQVPLRDGRWVCLYEKALEPQRMN